MDTPDSLYDLHVLVGCTRCHKAFCVSCTEPLSIVLPDDVVLIVANDFCPDCAGVIARRVLALWHSDPSR